MKGAVTGGGSREHKGNASKSVWADGSERLAGLGPRPCKETGAALKVRAGEEAAMRGRCS